MYVLTKRDVSGLGCGTTSITSGLGGGKWNNAFNKRWSMLKNTFTYSRYLLVYTSGEL